MRILSLLLLALAVATAAAPGWIEGLFGIDPDAGSGALEWLIVVVCVVAAVAVELYGRRRAKAE